MYLDTKDPRIKKIGDFYHARFSLKGVRVQRSLNTSSFKVAQQLLNDIESAILLGENWRKEKGIFDEIWSEFLEAKATGKLRGIKKVREKTLKDYIHFGERWFLPFFGSMRVDKVDADVWTEYLQHVKAESRSGDKTKMFNHWKQYSGFETYCIKRGYLVKKSDIFNPDQKDEADGVGINFTDEQLRLFRDHSAGPMSLWIFMGQFMGMRSSEITQLMKDRVDMDAMLIRLRKSDTKTKKDRKVPIHHAVVERLELQLDAHPDSPALFPNAWDSSRPMDVGGFKKPWTKLREGLGIRGRFHDFRHSHASRAFANPDINPVIVCAYLGMSMKVAMDVYIHFDDKHIRNAAAKLHL